MQLFCSEVISITKLQWFPPTNAEFFNSKLKIIHKATDRWQDSSDNSKKHSKIASYVELDTGLNGIKYVVKSISVLNWKELMWLSNHGGSPEFHICSKSMPVLNVPQCCDLPHNNSLECGNSSKFMFNYFLADPSSFKEYLWLSTGKVI